MENGNPEAPRLVNGVDVTKVIHWTIPAPYLVRFVTDLQGRLIIEIQPGKEQEVFDHLFQHLEFFRSQADLKQKAVVAERARAAQIAAIQAKRAASSGVVSPPVHQTTAPIAPLAAPQAEETGISQFTDPDEFHGI